jgi:hypothetical protein
MGIILKIGSRSSLCVDWICCDQNGVQWQDLVKKVLNHQILSDTGNFLTNRATISF